MRPFYTCSHQRVSHTETGRTVEYGRSVWFCDTYQVLYSRQHKLGGAPGTVCVCSVCVLLCLMMVCATLDTLTRAVAWGQEYPRHALDAIRRVLNADTNLLPELQRMCLSYLSAQQL